ncbi:MAG TPA: 2-dehydropantoate 2-reductase [Xanthobacteraceae bacterium]|jgi:2-dehydropantoate 2-reductase|nr:2-dehydropantoate 2-reductase [Xanthobacteraceae bacterium]
MTAGAQARRLSVAVIGLGGVGGGAAGSLAAAGQHDVIACVRQPIARFTLERAEGAVEAPLHVLSDPAQAKPVDWVLVCTKTHQTAAAGPWLARLCTPATRVAVLQNGIDHVARVEPLARSASIVPVLVYYNGERLAPDRVRIRHAGPHDAVVADDEPGRAFVDLFDGTPLRIVRSADFATLAWRKLLINAVANPITALTLQRQAVLRRPDVQELCRSILDEAVAVARAEGVKLAEDETARTIATLENFSGELGTSMYFDRLAGRRLEAEALTGAIVAAGDRYGMAMPLNRALLTLLRAINDAIGA